MLPKSMTKKIQKLLEGEQVDGLTLKDLTEAVRILCRCNNTRHEAQDFLDGNDEAGAALSEADLRWAMRQNPRRVAEERKRRRAKKRGQRN